VAIKIKQLFDLNRKEFINKWINKLIVLDGKVHIFVILMAVIVILIMMMVIVYPKLYLVNVKIVR